MTKKLLFASIFGICFLLPTRATDIKKDSLYLSQITTSEMLKSTDEWGIKWSGFITNDIFVDTRKPVEARDGGIFLYPTNLLLDQNGVDLNDRTSFNFVTMNTRLTAKIYAPKSLGASISGMIEGWFMGVSNEDMNGFALRHSFIKMDWERTHLLIGQTWHPLFTERMFPNTVTGNAGAPFQPFSRAPQIRFTQDFLQFSHLILYANVQRDMLSDGFDKKTSQYLRNSNIPQLGAQYILDYSKTNNDNLKTQFYLGFGADFKQLTPRIKTEMNMATQKKVNGFSALVFAHFTKEITEKSKFEIKVKSILAQNTPEFLMMGGYAIKEYHADSVLNYGVDFDYTPINVSSSWIDISYTRKSWQFGLMSGYAKNLGSSDRIQNPELTKAYFATLPNGSYILRFSPRVKYTHGKMQFCFEPEYTGVLYGTKQNPNGTVDLTQPTHYVSNIRFLVAVILFF